VPSAYMASMTAPTAAIIPASSLRIAIPIGCGLIAGPPISDVPAYGGLARW